MQWPQVELKADLDLGLCDLYVILVKETVIAENERTTAWSLMNHPRGSKRW